MGNAHCLAPASRTDQAVTIPRPLRGLTCTQLDFTSFVIDDLHMTFGALCAVAELQLALPGEIRTPRPLLLVLDRRPFI